MSTNLFELCGLVIESNLPFSELPRVSGRTAECFFELLPGSEVLSGEFDWFHHWPVPGDDPWLKFAVVGEEYLFRFPSCGDFYISRDTQRVRCQPLTGTPDYTIRHLFLDQVVPQILSRRESLVLHASAVRTDTGAIAFVGTGGRGKSTLATNLALRGWPLVADDFLVLREQDGQWLALPSYPGVRLWEEAERELFEERPPATEYAHYSSKRRIRPDLIPFAESPGVIRSLYFMEGESGAPTAEFSITPIPPRNTFIGLISFANNLDVSDRDFLTTQFRTVDKLLPSLQCFYLKYPHDFSALPAVCEMIRDHQTRNAQ